MRNVIYKVRTNKIVRVTNEEVCITKLNDDEDFTNENTWNEWKEINPELETLPSN